VPDGRDPDGKDLDGKDLDEKEPEGRDRDPLGNAPARPVGTVIPAAFRHV
jgi:hypothetical protein